MLPILWLFRIILGCALVLSLTQCTTVTHPEQSSITSPSMVKDTNSLSRPDQVQYAKMLANAREKTRSPLELITERIRLEHTLSDESVRANNRRMIWLLLTQLPEAKLHAFALEALDHSVEQGWARLALLAKQGSDGEVLYAEVEAWQTQYPHHPANELLPSPLSEMKSMLHRSPRQMALLLPLSGPLAGPGGAVRDGLMAQAENAGAKAIDIRWYDTATDDVATLYQKALADGADYVVGPLTKAEVVRIAGMDHPVPTLLLNDLDQRLSSNAYQFGLSPSHEARQVAIKAHSRGHQRAIVIAPAGSWGDEIVSAFTTQWQAEGGTVVDKLSYSADMNLNMAIRDLMQIPQAQARESRIKQLLGKSVQFTPSRRQDFDLVFLLAYPSKARQIMPLLKYYFIGQVPVYATSAVYSGHRNAMSDKDLDGIIFCDMPWVFAHQMTNKHWPEPLNSYSRLYALGMDSYALATRLNQLLFFPAMETQEHNMLYLNRSQQVARIPVWGTFKKGVVVALEQV